MPPKVSQFLRPMIRSVVKLGCRFRPQHDCRARMRGEQVGSPCGSYQSNQKETRSPVQEKSSVLRLSQPSKSNLAQFGRAIYSIFRVTYDPTDTGKMAQVSFPTPRHYRQVAKTSNRLGVGLVLVTLVKVSTTQLKAYETDPKTKKGTMIKSFSHMKPQMVAGLSRSAAVLGRVSTHRGTFRFFSTHKPSSSADGSLAIETPTSQQLRIVALRAAIPVRS